ncbi:MAG: oligosaccharide flippase family protein, partial [Acidobacteria bacterium]|nr:oligosaccharide flippase family protein [Acidobacteriota bacterium]
MDLIESRELSNPQPPVNVKLSRKFRKIGINFSTRIVGNVVGKLFSLITIPLIARALGPESYGQFNLVNVALTYTAFLVDFGFNSYGVRESARQENSHSTHSTVSQILSARLTIALVSILVSAIGLFIIFNHNRRLVMIVYLGFIWVIAGAMNIDYHYFGKKNMLVPTLSQLSGQVFYVVA